VGLLNKQESLKFFDHIKNFHRGKTIPRKFLHWYILTQFGDRITGHYTISDNAGDGKIDAIVPVGKLRYVLQSKLHKKTFQGVTSGAVKDHIELFDDIIRKYNDANKFKKYLKKSVRKKHHTKFTELRKYYKKYPNRVIFEFITTHTTPKEEPGVDYLQKENILCYDHFERLYQNYLVGRTPPAKPMKLNLLPLGETIIKQKPKNKKQKKKKPKNKPITPLILKLHDKQLGVNSWIIKTPVRDFVNYLSHDPNLNSISANIRMKISPSSINDGILNSFLKDSDIFWYLHNGIYLISDKVQPNGKTVTIKEPNIINGSQTVLTLRDSNINGNTSAVWVRILERNGGITDEKLIQKIIEGTNSQNKTYQYDLKSNHPLQVNLYREFLRQGIFYEKSRGEWEEKNTLETYSEFKPLKTVKLAQIRVLCQEGANGVVLLKKETEGLYHEKHPLNKNLHTKVTFRKTFGGNFKTIYFQYLLFLFVEDVFSKIKDLPGRQRNYLKFSVFGKLWKSIKNNKSGLQVWQNVICPKPAEILKVKNKKTNKLVNDVKKLVKEFEKKYRAEEKKYRTKRNNWERMRNQAEEDGREITVNAPKEVTRKMYVDDSEFNELIFKIRTPPSSTITGHLNELCRESIKDKKRTL